nr:DNA-binding protein Ets97D isoform X1 [Nothobranchius furzeri]
MNSFQDSQSDLEVILEFLEEYYRQNTTENAATVPVHERPVDGSQPCEQCWTCFEPSVRTRAHNFAHFWCIFSLTLCFLPSPTSKDIKPIFHTSLAHNVQPESGQNTKATLSQENFASTRHPAAERVTARSTPPGRRLRLFHFLFEMLEDPSMAHCLSWMPAAAADGVFCFSSRNKEQVAILWGQMKGNKRPMTYQKMSRALRNYARSGHIFKVKRKLTYQFSRDTLISLQEIHGRHL